MSDDAPGTTSAVPADLMAYSRAAVEIDEQIHQLAVRLGRVLDAYRATNPEFGSPIPRIEDDLERHARRCLEIDRRVASLAAAFERAGASSGSPSILDSELHAAMSALGTAAAAAAAFHGLEAVGAGMLHAIEGPEAGGAQRGRQDAVSDLAGATHHLVEALSNVVGDASTEVLGDAAAAGSAGTPDARALDALDHFRRHLDASSFLGGDRGDLEGIDRKLSALSPEELDWVIGRLSRENLREWTHRMFETGDFLFHHDGLLDEEKVSLANTLLRAGPEQLERLRREMPWLEPGWSVDDTHPTGWQSGEQLPLFAYGSVGPEPEDDINQGWDGDCWFLSAIGAIAERRPDCSRDTSERTRTAPSRSRSIAMAVQLM